MWLRFFFLLCCFLLNFVNTYGLKLRTIYTTATNKTFKLLEPASCNYHEYLVLLISYLYFLLSVPYPACTSDPCLHNGTCMDGTNDPEMNFDETGYHCLCVNGYEGKNCERKWMIYILGCAKSKLHYSTS